MLKGTTYVNSHQKNIYLKKTEGEEEKEAPPVWKSDGMPEKLKRLFAFFDHVNNYFLKSYGNASRIQLN